METQKFKASVDGLGKRGNNFTFLVCIESTFKGTLCKGAEVTVQNVPVIISNFEDNYLSFELPLEQVLGTGLVEVEIGSEVTITPGKGSTGM